MNADPVHVRHIYISPGHNFFGHHGREPDQYPIREVREVNCVAGAGLEGDRFFNYKDNYKGQITFLSWETYIDLCSVLNVHDRDPSVLRRNVIVEGVRLSDWIGQEFEIQGIRFAGIEESKPCYWMDRAFAPGAEAALQGRGGLRARILTSGLLRSESAPE